jgi:hypothetical protein
MCDSHLYSLDRYELFKSLINPITNPNHLSRENTMLRRIVFPHVLVCIVSYIVVISLSDIHSVYQEFKEISDHEDGIC